MRRPLLALGLLAMTVANCHPSPHRTFPVRLGATGITLAVHSTDRPGLALLVLHADERTALGVGLERIRDRGGRLVEVEARGNRLVAFELLGQTWRFDPNRIFTDAGAEATLLEYNGSAPPAVFSEVRGVAAAILETYGTADPTVALHNNTDGEYSAASYLPEGDLAEDAAAVHLPLEADPDDFFFVTEPGLYTALSTQGFAVVLQDNARVTDDGSLSVWAARQGLPYVNVEAEHGHRERQREMLEALARVLDSRVGA